MTKPATSMANRKTTPAKARPAYVSVAVVHPAHATRIGLASMVNDVAGHRATVVVADGNALLKALRSGTPVHLALVAQAPPATDAPNLLALLHHRYPELGIVALCHAIDDLLTGQALSDHARSVLPDDVAPAELGTMLANVRAHHFHPSEPVKRLLHGEHLRPSAPRTAARLTPRERVALAWWCNPLWLTKPQVARRMGISVNCVKTLLRHAYKKMGVKHRTAAARWWHNHRNDWN